MPLLFLFTSVDVFFDVMPHLFRTRSVQEQVAISGGTLPPRRYFLTSPLFGCSVKVSIAVLCGEEAVDPLGDNWPNAAHRTQRTSSTANLGSRPRITTALIFHFIMLFCRSCYAFMLCYNYIRNYIVLCGIRSAQFTCTGCVSSGGWHWSIRLDNDIMRPLNYVVCFLVSAAHMQP